MELLSLPPELITLVVSHLAKPSELVHLAATATVFARITDEVARERCSSVTRKGLWCAGASWRVQSCGRSYRSTTRVRKHFCTAGIGRRSIPPSEQALVKPTACCVLADGQTVVVCDVGNRSLVFIDLASGDVLGRFAVDGLPTGIVALQESSPEHSVFELAVVIQAMNEDGSALDGVSNAHHRIQLMSVSNSDMGELSLGGWWSCFELSYPNGACRVTYPGSSDLLCCANWNGHTALGVHTEAHGWFPADDVHGISAVDGALASTVVANNTLARPADVAWLRFTDTDAGALAIPDYYGGMVRIFRLPGKEEVLAAAGAERAPQVLRLWATLVPSPRRRKLMDRPSAVAVDNTRANSSFSKPKLRILVAETGSMLISVFEIDSWRDTSSAGTLTYRHITDICTEQLGTGLHLPQQGQWSWLGLDVTSGGDVVAVDMDNGCAYLI